MATVGTATKQQTNKTASTEVSRAAKWAYVEQLQSVLTKKDKDAALGVFVVPAFTADGKNTGNVVVDTISPTLFRVQVMSIGESVYNKQTGFYTQVKKQALIFATKKILEENYKAGVNIGGRIVTHYTVGTGRDADIMMGVGTEIPAVNEDGEIIYRTQRWSPDMEDQDDPMPVIANQKEINEARAIKSVANQGKLPAGAGVRK